jgi:hypothetical protein
VNPWIILAIVVAFVCSGGGCYVWGSNAKENQMEAQHARDTETRIKQHNEDSAIDMQAAAEWGAKQARARKLSDGGAAALVADIQRAPMAASCGLDDISLRLLRASVDRANDLSPAADGVPDAVPGVTAGSERRAELSPSMGGFGLKPSGRLSPPTR